MGAGLREIKARELSGIAEYMEQTAEASAAGSRLRSARKARGIKPEDLAARLSIAPSTVRAHENGQNGIPAHQAAAYAEALGITPQYLLYGDGLAPTTNVIEFKPTSGTNTPPPVRLTSNRDGTALLEVSMTIPMATALKVLALLEGGE